VVIKGNGYEEGLYINNEGTVMGKKTCLKLKLKLEV